MRCREKLVEVGLKIRFFGDFSLLTDEVKQHVHEVMEETKDNATFCLNICFSYTGEPCPCLNINQSSLGAVENYPWPILSTGRNDIVRSVGHVLQAVRDQTLDVSHISERVLDAALDTRDSPPMDLVVRTSGEVRLSDFLLWQVSFGSSRYSML
jgi:undecaprenyl pyrophosphate synthase